jgi:CHAT domain-containing protein
MDKMNGVRPEALGGASTHLSARAKKIFSLEFTREGDTVLVRSCEGFAGELHTLRKCDVTKISLIKTIEYSDRIKKLLSNANREGSVGKEILENLKQTGQLLYDALLPSRTKENLNTTDVKNLVLGLDDRLVNIPWELLYDGKEFLCQRFNMGRVISTRQEFSAKQRELGTPLKILLLADPQDNLISSYDEGVLLRDLLDEKNDLAETDLKCSDISVDYVKGKLKLYDIVHYAGHADYNAQNPAESGLLLSDGKLKASDIKGMAGRTPFPAFVFSNGCNSGETAEWEMGQGYENVFGLANAFLISGVRHYLGTFWEIQDEPSQLFALSFYEELMNGAMIGEAVRSARRRLIENFGEDTVIWASYMLYGDPTSQYVHAIQPVQYEEKPAAEVTESYGGALRSAESAVPSFRLRRKAYISSIPLIALAVVLAVFLLNNRWSSVSQDNRKTTVPVVVEKERTVENERIDKLIKELVTKYHQGNYPTPIQQNVWKSSSPLSLVFLDINGSGISEIEKDVIFGKVIEDLQATKRIDVVDRQILDKLLTELNLSASELADPATALKLGKILSARLIATGNIVRQKNEWLISLRVIETETSAIKAAISMFLEEKDQRLVAGELGSEILQRIKKVYPLQAKISSVEGDRIIIDLGASSGMSVGFNLEVLTDGLQRVGTVETVSVRDKDSLVKVHDGNFTIQEGLRVREIYMPDG